MCSHLPCPEGGNTPAPFVTTSSAVEFFFISSAVFICTIYDNDYPSQVFYTTDAAAATSS